MTIRATNSNLHWNYFIALEHDLEVASRYVEFAPQNFEVYSIEFAHLLFAAASEVDVIAKLLCMRLQPTMPHGNIDEYRAVLTRDCADIVTAAVYVPRYGLEFKPWDNWSGATNPLWWRSYNNVKHARDTYFREATLKNALNAMGALMILAQRHYRYELVPPGANPLADIEVNERLQPQSTLLRFDDANYYQPIVAAVG